MKILKMKVNWNDGIANNPELQILASDIPTIDEMEFLRDGELFFSEKDGYVRFFTGNPDKPGRGFGGREFILKMCNGTQTKLIGPFSSRAAVMNAAGMIECMDVAITDSEEVYEKGYTFTAGSVTVQIVKHNWHKLQDLDPDREKMVYLVEPPTGSQDIWIPSIDSNVVIKPSITSERAIEVLRDAEEKSMNGLFESPEAKEHIKEMSDNMKNLNATQADVLKSDAPRKEWVMCTKHDVCDRECPHKEPHKAVEKGLDNVSYSRFCDTFCSENKLAKCSLCGTPKMKPEEALESMLQGFYSSDDISDLNLTVMMKKEYQYNAIIREILYFLECPIKGVSKPNSDHPNRVVYDDDDLKMLINKVKKAMKALEED